jgi:hypothetical protein
MEIENDKAGKNHNLGVLAALLPTSMSLKVAQVTFNIIILATSGVARMGHQGGPSRDNIGLEHCYSVRYSAKTSLF